MKPAIAILALFVASFALPWLTAQAMRRAWRRGQVSSRSGYSGAVLANLILRRCRIRGVGVVEGRRLFYDKFDTAAQDVVLSQPVHDGRTVSALAHAALHTGHALQHVENSKPYRRLLYWNHTLRLVVNAMPVILVLLLFHPGGLRTIPFLALFFFLLAGIQVLTFPAVRDAAERARHAILEHQLLPPEEMSDFQKALKGATERHLAAPLLDCFWLRWLF